jgi:hypothetical protein
MAKPEIASRGSDIPEVKKSKEISFRIGDARTRNIKIQDVEIIETSILSTGKSNRSKWKKGNITNCGRRWSWSDCAGHLPVPGG